MLEKKLILVLPSTEYKDSYLESIKEVQADETSTVVSSEKNLDLAELSKDENFEAYVNQLRNESKGIDLPTDYVPHTTYWMIEQKNGDNVFIGRIDIRHRLNEALINFGGHIGYMIRPSYRSMGCGSKILQLGLEKAKQHIEDYLDFDSQILITCNINNLGSQKIIEKSGGQLLKVVDLGPFEADLMHYWVEL